MFVWRVCMFSLLVESFLCVFLRPPRQLRRRRRRRGDVGVVISLFVSFVFCVFIRSYVFLIVLSLLSVVRSFFRSVLLGCVVVRHCDSLVCLFVFVLCVGWLVCLLDCLSAGAVASYLLG